VGSDRDTLHLQGRDRVATKPAGGRGVKKLGVFIAVQGKPHFHPKPPVEGSFLNSEVKGIHGKGAKVIFREGEGAIFF
jgi:hypothetical protein